MILRSRQLLLLTGVLLANTAWAQSDTDLPALPPGMESPPAIELPPPPALPPAEEPAPAPAAEAPTFTPETAPPAATAEPAPATEPAPAAETAAQPQDVFEPASAPAQPAADAAATPPADGEEIKQDFKPSYGDFQQSLLFSPADIDRMKKVLYMYERVKRPDGAVAPVQDEFAKLLDVPQEVIPTIAEPEKYPSYYLSSIVYRSPRDWLFWMNGSKYSPKKLPGGMEIVSISARQVTLIWKPEYISTAEMRYEQENYDHSMPKHFRSRMSQVRYDKEKGHFLVTLSPNQTFISAAFGVYEGKYADREVPEIVQEAQVQEILDNPEGPPPTQNMNDPDAALKETMRGLQKVNNNLSQLSPRSAVDANGQPIQQQPQVPEAMAPGMSESGTAESSVAAPPPERAM